MNRTAVSRWGAPRSRLIGSQLTPEPPSGVMNAMWATPSGVVLTWA